MNNIFKYVKNINGFRDGNKFFKNNNKTKYTIFFIVYLSAERKSTEHSILCECCLL